MRSWNHTIQLFYSDVYDKETVDNFRGGAHTCTCTFRMYITVSECEGLRGVAGGRVAMMLKRDREHSDWPIVVQRSDNAGNWPSLDKTAKWSAAAHSGATATLFQSRKSSGTPAPRAPHSHAPIPDAKLPHFSVLTAGRCIDDRARMVMQSRVVSDVSYTRDEGMICHRRTLRWNFYRLS